MVQSAPQLESLHQNLPLPPRSTCCCCQWLCKLRQTRSSAKKTTTNTFHSPPHQQFINTPCQQTRKKEKKLHNKNHVHITSSFLNPTSNFFLTFFFLLFFVFFSCCRLLPSICLDCRVSASWFWLFDLKVLFACNLSGFKKKKHLNICISHGCSLCTKNTRRLVFGGFWFALLTSVARCSIPAPLLRPTVKVNWLQQMLHRYSRNT